MEIQYVLTQRDFQEAMYAHRKARTFTRWFYRILTVFVILISLLIVLGALGAAAQHSAHAFTSFSPLLILTVGWAALLWLMPMWMARNQFRNQPGVQGGRIVSIDEAGIRSRWNGGSSDAEWKNYIRYFEAKNQVLLYTSPACFNILPKRAFQPPENLATFLNMLKRNLPGK
jgi:hypothetical protein